MRDTVEYLFVRIPVTGVAAVSLRLCDLANEGWRVVSHCECRGEYSFVLVREHEGEGDADHR